MRRVFLDKFINPDTTLFHMLSDIYGLNRRSIDYLLLHFGFTPDILIDDLDLPDIVLLEDYIIDHFFTYQKLKDIKSEILEEIKLSNNSRSFKYKYKLPANGQRTHTNAQTSKKK